MRKLSTKQKLGLLLCLTMSLSAGAALTSCGIFGEPTKSEQSTASEYTVTFVTNGGSEIDPMTVAAGEYAEKPDNPTKAGHIFKGWFLDLEDPDATAFLFDETAINADITLYAKWQIRTFSVSYQDADGNAIDGLAGGTVNWGSTLEKPDETAIARDGYIIKWYNASGEIWDFETSKVVSNTTLTYRYVTTKDTYNAAEIAENFYPVLDKTITDPEKVHEYYTEGAETVFYTYATTNLQQVVVNVELSTLDYDSVSIVARTTDVNLDASQGGDFTQLRAYIKTDLGGNVSYNDEPSSGYDPLHYYIQSTGTNKDLFSAKAVEGEGGWTTYTFNLAALKLWNEATRLDSFAFGFVSSTKGIEIQSIVFNKVDKEAQYTVSFTDNLGNAVAEAQTVTWNDVASKPATAPAGDANHVYTGEWLTADGEVFDFENTKIRSDITLYPQYTVENKYSWTGAEVAQDFRAVYNASVANPAAEVVTDGRSIFTYNNGAAGNSLEQIAIDNLNVAIGSNKYLTMKWRTVNFADYTYAEGAFALIRMYVLTDKGGSVLKNNLDDKDSYYLNFANISATAITTPVDMSAKDADGWYTVTIDLSVLPYFAQGTTLYGFAVGTTTGQGVKAIEVASIALVESIPEASTKTVSFVDAEGNAIAGLDAQTVPTGKAAAMPDTTLLPAIKDMAFSHWADEDGNEFKFSNAVTEDVTLKAVYVSNWTGEEINYVGQQIVDAFTSSHERYGNTVNAQHNLTLVDGNAVAAHDSTTVVNANKVITMLNAGLRVHEGSKMVVTFKSSAFAEGYTYTQFKMGIAFRGEDPATTIHNGANPMHYFQYTKIAAGTMSGSSDTAFISFEVAEDGTVTVTLDLWAMSQASAPTVGDSVDVNYIDAFSFMIVETNSATTPTKNACQITYSSIKFVDVQQDAKQDVPGDSEGNENEGEEGGENEGEGETVAVETVTYSGQQIVDNFKYTFERYAKEEARNAQKELTLVDGNATATYDMAATKPNKALVMTNANINVVEGSKLVITFKSSAFAEGYTYTQFKLSVSFAGEDATSKYHDFQYTKIAAGTMSGSSDTVYISFEVAADGTVTVTCDLYKMSQSCAGSVEAGVDASIIDTFTLMVVEAETGTTVAKNVSTFTYESIQLVDVKKPATNDEER